MKKNIIDYISVTLFLLFTSFISITAAYFLSKKVVRPIFNEYHVLVDLFIFLLFYIMFNGFLINFCLKLKPLKKGVYKMTDKEMTYWKFIVSVTELGGRMFIPFTPLFFRPLFFRLLGCKVGKGTEIAGIISELQMVEIGDYAMIGGDSHITAHSITYNKVILKPIKLCDKVTIGVGAIVFPGVEIGENSIVAGGSFVPADTKIPPNEIWGGVPAKKIKEVKNENN